MMIINGQKVERRFIGDKEIIGRYLIFCPEHMSNHLIHHFDAIDNQNNNDQHDNDATGWIDKATGLEADILSGTWESNGLSLTGNGLVKFYDNNTHSDYTIMNTHTITGYSAHSRVCGEFPAHSLYLQTSTRNYSLYGGGQDKMFSDPIAPSTLNLRVQIALRYTASTKTMELFFNGVKLTEMTAVNTFARQEFLYLGNRATLDRGFVGKIHEHLMYDVALTNAEIEREFLVSKTRFNIK